VFFFFKLLIASRDWVGLAQHCEEVELRDWQTQDALNGRIGMAACLLASDLNRARFLWKRSTSLHGDAQFMAVWGVGRAMWTKDQPGVHTALTAALAASDGVVAQLLHLLQEAVQDDSMKLIALAYETIKVSDAAALLGMSDAATTERCTAAGWALEATMLRPVAPEVASSSAVSQDSLKRLTAHMIELDA